ASVREILEAANDVTGTLAQELVRINLRGTKLPEGKQKLREQILGLLENTIHQIQDIIFQLPADLADTLNKLLLETKLTANNKLFQFQADGKKLKKELEQLLSGTIRAGMIFGLNSFFTAMLTSLGVNVKSANDFVQGKLDEFLNTKGKEERAALGQEFLRNIQTFVDAFNFLNDNLNDSVSKAIAQINSLSQDLGFEGIPTIDELKASLKELFEAAELDPDTIQKYLDLRNAIVGLAVSLTQSIGELVSFIDSLNTKIAALGGSTTDTSGAVKTSIDTLKALLEAGGLSPEEKQSILQQMSGLVDQWVQQQTTAQETVIQGNRDVVEAQIKGIQDSIDALQEQKKLIQENARAQIDNLNAEKERLNDELRIQQQLLDLSESIKQNIQDLILGPQSIDTSFQRLTQAQGIISGLFAQLQTATPEQKIGIGKQAQDLLNDLLSIGGEAFQQPSLESRDLFRSVIEQLEDLQDLVGPTRSIEEINASIEAIDQQIVDINTQMEASLASIDAQTDALRNQIDQLRDTIVDTQTIQTQIMGPAAEEAKAYYEFIRDEATKILDLRLQQLADLGIDNLGSLTTM
ncbi:MAG TPA: hypothetical protein VH878_08665, partial [Thermodesulfobacteriota bacterium]